MATYILVHGAWHGSWCWDKIVKCLKKKGHKVEAPDLPGHGKDKTPIEKVTLQKCVKKICEIIEAQSEPVILVGHSMGGVIISQVAETFSSNIRILVYLTAFLVRNGESIKTILDRYTSSNINWNKKHIYLEKKGLKDQFYGDCSTEIFSLAEQLLGPESTDMLKTPLTLTENSFGKIPRVYIQCLNDKAVPLSLQKKMYEALSCQSIISMKTSHSPFFSAPEELVKNLDKIDRLFT